MSPELPPGCFGKRFQELEQEAFGCTASAIVFDLIRRRGDGGSNRGDGRFDEAASAPFAATAATPLPTTPASDKV